MQIDELFNSFSTKKILVIGDVMIDSYIEGNVTRISPEAPVPIVHFTNKENRLGGAANVALNVIALGAEVYVASVIGKDKDGEELIRLFEESHIHTNAIVQSKNRCTTVKTRIIGNKQQLIRIDEEQTDDLNSSEEMSFIDSINHLVTTNSIDAIIFEDYNKGVLTENVIQSIISTANKKGIITTVDPKKKNFFSYKNVTLFKPNLKELKEGLNVQFDVKKEFHKLEEAIEELHNKLENQISFITLSAEGVYIIDERDKYHFPAHLRNIADVSGAGDTVISVATLCLTADCSIDIVAQIANLAGGLVCEHVGVVPIDKQLLVQECKRLF